MYLQNYDRGACENMNFKLFTFLETCYSKSILEKQWAVLQLRNNMENHLPSISINIVLQITESHFRGALQCAWVHI